MQNWEKCAGRNSILGKSAEFHSESTIYFVCLTSSRCIVRRGVGTSKSREWIRRKNKKYSTKLRMRRKWKSNCGTFFLTASHSTLACWSIRENSKINKNVHFLPFPFLPFLSFDISISTGGGVIIRGTVVLCEREENRKFEIVIPNFPDPVNKTQDKRKQKIYIHTDGQIRQRM